MNAFCVFKSILCETSQYIYCYSAVNVIVGPDGLLTKTGPPIMSM